MSAVVHRVGLSPIQHKDKLMKRDFLFVGFLGLAVAMFMLGDAARTSRPYPDRVTALSQERVAQLWQD